MEATLKMGVAKAQGSFSLQLFQLLSLRDGQNSNISHSAPSYFLLRLNSGQIWLRDGGLLLPPNRHSWDGGSTLGVECTGTLSHLQVLSSTYESHGESRKELKLLALHRGSALKAGVSLREKCPVVLTPSFRAKAQEFLPWRRSRP